MSARATWKGLLQISLVTIPIKVFPATEASASLSFNQLHERTADTDEAHAGELCHARVQQKRWCAKCDREVPMAEIVKGYEFEKDKYVLVNDDELAAIAPLSAKVIDLVQFVEASALEPRLVDRAYYLAPDGPDGGPAQAAYGILCEAMAGSVGIGKLAIYGREYLVAVGPQHGTLLLYTLHYAAELREAPYAAPNPRAVRGTFTLPAAEVTLAQRVILALAGPLSLTDFTDEYRDGVRQLIAAKIAGVEYIVPAIAETAGAVLNLKASLEMSLDAVRATKGTKAAKVSIDTKERKRA